jgi:hypothetical protein
VWSLAAIVSSLDLETSFTNEKIFISMAETPFPKRMPEEEHLDEE